MNPVVLVAALIGAGAILLIFWGLFGARRDEVQDRLERYASPGGGATPEKTEEQQQGAAEPAGPAGRLTRLPGLQQDRREARLGCQPGTRARPRGPGPQALRVPGHPVRRHHRPARHHVPAGRHHPALAGQPAGVGAGAGHRLVAAEVLARTDARASGSRHSTAVWPTPSRSSPTRCEPAPRSCSRSRWWSARPSRPSRPSSIASSARSTWACPSSRRSTTWSAACGPTTWS